MRGERLSVPRVAPSVTTGVAGRAVAYQEVAVVSLTEFERATASLKPATAVMAMAAAAVLMAVVAAPPPLLPQAASGAVQSSLWCPPTWQAAKLPRVHLRAERLPPATKLMPQPFPPLTTAESMTRGM